MQMDPIHSKANLIHHQATSPRLRSKGIIHTGLNHVFTHVFHNVQSCLRVYTCVFIWNIFQVAKIYILHLFKDINLQKRTEQKKKNAFLL